MLVETAMRTIPKYRAPQGYIHKQGRTLKEKVYLPVADFPGLNFIGQLLGPRGRSLAEMNARSGANIVLRGRGSVKEGKGRRSFQVGQDEPLHCLISADNQDTINKAKTLIQEVIENVVTSPEHANERKRQQLRDLAKVNGTFRDDEGRSGSRLLESTAPTVVCHGCGGYGHIVRDCTDRKKDAPWRQAPWQHPSQDGKDEVDLAVSQFLSEL